MSDKTDDLFNDECDAVNSIAWFNVKLKENKKKTG